MSCFLACFTDSFKSSDGQAYYGFATFREMCLFDYQAVVSSSLGVPDLSKYRMSFIDGVYAVLSVFVFVAVALREKNVLSCFYPMPAHETQEPLNFTENALEVPAWLLYEEAKDLNQNWL
ncbi:hypothetical protein F0562_029059 [Nyssa sinensis]|uniref:Uncharacterized protein n=1 Tax=Nyssa sinensis TaxID=561372 RepID=A0A5J5B606_9ASTE|nr:hypothetical protein F0562_029059 [Nyssa sinensis]